LRKNTFKRIKLFRLWRAKNSMGSQRVRKHCRSKRCTLRL